MQARRFAISALAGVLLTAAAVDAEVRDGAITSEPATVMSAPLLLQKQPHLIPQPVSLAQGSGHLILSPDMIIFAGEDLSEPANQLAAFLTPVLGKRPRISQTAPDPLPATAIALATKPSLASLSPDAYELRVSAGEGVQVLGASPSGVFCGMQTLRQLLPPEVEGDASLQGKPIAIPEVEIQDHPRFAWRGLMLDSCRHFLSVEDIKKFIDVMALHKYNVLHWHLTEDQGWRIEIKKYPKLTEIGSLRSESPVKGNRNKGDATPYGPYFYTQDQVRDIVAYAAAQFITVVPEIELPGHSRAALAAYPHLGCTGGPYEVRTRWGVESDIYCAGKEEPFAFLEDVLTEVIDLFPSPIIHIGGDEAPKKRWEKCETCQARIKAEGLEDEHELQSYFIQRIEKFLNAKGRTLIGWDEILEGGLAPNASVMSWRGVNGGITAAKAGHNVVMSPTSHCYFDYAQARGPDEPEAIGGHLPLRKVYSYDPVPAVLTTEETKHVLGVQGNLWSEYLYDLSVVEYFGFPRACALAEVAWSPRDDMDYENFMHRLPHHLKRLDGLKVNYRPLSPEPIPLGQWRSGETSEDFQTMTWDFSPKESKAGTYRIRFQYTGGAHRLDIEWCGITKDGQRVAVDEHPGITGGMTKDSIYSLAMEAPRPGAVYQVWARVRSDGGSDSQGDVILEDFTPR